MPCFSKIAAATARSGAPFRVAKRIVKAVRGGNYLKPAAEAARVSEATFHRWMKAGREAKSGIQHDFYEAVKQAESEVELELAARILKAAGEDWRAALALLERRHPERWGRRQSLEHTGAAGAPLTIKEVVFDDPETKDALREALRAVGDARASKPNGSGDDERGEHP